MVSNYRYILYALVYLKQYWKKLIFILATSGIGIVLSLIPVEIFRRLIDIAIPAKDLPMVFNMLLIVFGIHLILLVIGYIQDLTITKLNMDITRKMQSDFFNKLLHVPATYYEQFNAGQLMERVIDDTEETVDSTFDLILTPILDVIGIIITIIYMFITSAQLTLVALAFVPVFILITFSVNRIVRKKYTKIKNSYADVFNIIQEKFARVKEVITHNQVKYETNDLTKHIKSYNDLEYDYEKFSLKLGSVTSIIADLAPYAILVYATILIIKGKFEIGTLLAFSMLMPRLFEPVQELAGKELDFQTLGVTAKRVFSILHDAKIMPEGEKKLKEGEVEGRIEFRKVDFDFPETKLFQKFNRSEER